MPTEVVIIGCGPGGAEYLLPAATAALKRADAAAGAERLFDLFPDFPGRRIPLRRDGVEALLEEVAAEPGRVAVLVSGDPGLYSLSAQVLERFGLERCRVVPGISSVQVAFARLGLGWEGARVLSAHAGGRLPEAEEFRACERIAILAGNSQTDAEVCRLATGLSGTHRLAVCRDLTLPEERITYPKETELAEHLGRGRVLVVLFSGFAVPEGVGGEPR